MLFCTAFNITDTVSINLILMKVVIRRRSNKIIMTKVEVGVSRLIMKEVDIRSPSPRWSYRGGDEI
jgi:hypothetical protein